MGDPWRMRLSRCIPRQVGIVVVGLLSLWSVLLSACGDVPTTVVSPLAPPTPTFTVSADRKIRLSNIDVYRSVTAAESFSVALQAAQAWRQDADWYGIVPYTSMERAFAIPLDDNSPSWFFRFGVPESKAEYIVEVLRGEVIGVNEISLPTYIEPSLGELDPLSTPWDVIDSTDVLKAYLKQPGSMLARSSRMWVDYRLTKPKAKDHPVWTLYNAQNLAEPIFVINAATGEAIPLE
jgi:hypothetical protein